ncbi:PR domain zinc finger protein 5-like isoform X1 [Maniola jurtina]|uniref:PR domain zinc finger protein 5-like isoform X1 n=1 Tax=Maniola jurtina TaxID=191418 RepID=UPI001E68F16D|nr:PR domain zinc finger protein 5-like isoform X1 [Maniola jurtina]
MFLSFYQSRRETSARLEDLYKMEEEEIVIGEMDADHPILFIPKHLTTLETNCAVSDNVFIDLNITSADSEGNVMNVYSGFCNVKVINSYDVDDNDGEMNYLSDSDNVLGEITLPDSNDSNETEMLIDPTYNPYVSGAMEAENYSIYQSHREHITVRQHRSYLKRKVNNYSESMQYAQFMEFEHTKFKQVKMSNETNPQHVDPSLNDQLECGLFLTQLPEEIRLANENRAREERKYIDLPSDNVAIKQLMSSEVQAMPRTQHTIMLLGDNSQNGQTIQTMAINDPRVKCLKSCASDFAGSNLRQKKYQCENCKQLFYQISAFRQHIQGIHTPNSQNPDGPTNNGVGFICIECNKSFKSREKFETHCLGHGNPDVECSQCKKVFASKTTLQNHMKIHLRKHKCPYCRKRYQKFEDLTAHLEQAHLVSKCDVCNFSSSTSALEKHRDEHKLDGVLVQEPDFEASNSEDILSLNDWPASAVDYSVPYVESRHHHDSGIAQATSNELFLRDANKAKKCKTKRCNICLKTFDRLSDLKRHLIEHIVRSSLAKNPSDDSGILCINCDICQSQTFSRIDEYKAHLREHAKLTTYKCTICAKTFSDSSNFSKHKKVHGNKYFQCDMCKRKFNSKRTLTQHIEYHIKNAPLKCNYCDKEFYCQSSLNKHIKLAHKCRVTRYKCTICDDLLDSLKEKWDHEWMVHKIRKIVVDCLLCGEKFRKYSELKRHCKLFHEIEIPPAKRLLKKRKARK